MDDLRLFTFDDEETVKDSSTGYVGVSHQQTDDILENISFIKQEINHAEQIRDDIDRRFKELFLEYKDEDFMSYPGYMSGTMGVITYEFKTPIKILSRQSGKSIMCAGIDYTIHRGYVTFFGKRTDFTPSTNSITLDSLLDVFKHFVEELKVFVNN